MRVLVTGASGFIGEHCLPALAAAGHEVAGTWLGDASPALGKGYSVDLTVSASVSAAVADFQPDIVLHLAGASHVGTSWRDMGSYYRVNVLGTENVLDAVGDRQVILASSAEVYGPVPVSEQPIAEERTPDPTNPYALTKAAAERLVLRHGGIVARLFNLVGPGQSETFALPTFARQLRAIARGERSAELEVGNLEARRDFVHVRDGAEALVRLVEQGQSATTYQVATGLDHSVGEILQRLITASGIEVEIRVDPDRFRPNDIPLLVGRADRLRSLGWSPQRSVEDAVVDLWQSLEETTVGEGV